MSSTTSLRVPGPGPRTRLLTPIAEVQKPKSPTFYGHSEARASPSSAGLVRAHLMMILAQAFFAGNYVCFKAFSRHSEDIFGKTSATIFSLMRGIVSLVLLPIIFYASPDGEYAGELRLGGANVKPVLIQGLAGATRLNIVPYGLMFTGAASAGVVQPFVPVCTCMLAVAFGLEKGNKIKYLSMLIGCMGVFIAAKGYDFGGVDLGILILLG
ncbi:hypothetical protein FOZ61_010543, partial [Perkinsus olseni]